MRVIRIVQKLTDSLKFNQKLIFRLIFLLPTLAFFAFISRPDDGPLDKLLTQLQHWTDSIPQEKVYLHMDKPYYALGDTIWFKGYVTVGSRHQLSALSGAVYVDLLNERDSVLKALKLPVTSGMVMGDFVLIDDYKQGNYRIRAYTQWMRNAGPEYFFDRTFTVGDLLSHNTIAKADYQYKTIDGKEVLTALLNFTDDEGRALGERNLRYQIFINKKAVWAQNIKTDALGSVSIKIDNAGKSNLNGAFIRTTIDGSGKNTIVREFPIKAGQAQADVQFFPEGGNLINGVASKVAFKAVGVDGLGLAIKGKVVDQTGTTITTLETLHAGMGTFILMPQAGKTYSALVNLPNGTTLTTPLPQAATEGYTLSVHQPAQDSLLVRIHASPGMLNQPQGLNLIAQTGGEHVFSSAVKIERAITSIWMDKKSFPSGVAQFTLFSYSGEPLSERIAFIRNKDLLELDIQASKDTYKSKERSKITLTAKDSKGKPTAGNFSVAIIDEGKMPVEESRESTILSYILLKSDLKGYVERPNYYFTKESPELNRALDNLMLTQGYRRFAWKQLDSLNSAKPRFEVERLGTKVSGRVTTLTNKPVAKATVTLLSVIAGVTKFTETDENGRFKFDSLFVTDSIKLTVQARGKSNTDKVKVLLDNVPKLTILPNPNLGDISTDIAATIKEYIENGKKLDDIYEQSGQLGKVHRLREVRIKARKPAPPPYSNQGMYRIPEGVADQTIIINPEDSITQSLGAWLALKAKLVVFKPLIGSMAAVINYPWVKDLTMSPPVVVPMVVMLDGRKVDMDEAAEILDGFQVPTESVYKVEIVWSTRALMQSLGGPALMIFTKRGYVRTRYTPSIVNFTPKGYNKVREFYQPRYDRPGASKLPDYRTTILWNPYLKTDTNGKAEFSYFNADGPASYKVIVEGINADGELGRQVFRYNVDATQAEAALPAFNKPDKALAAITAPLDSFNTRLPTEKVYLHTDKPFYNIGDTLWFKSYLVNGANNTPSKLSGLMYVELVDDSTVLASRVNIRVKDGVAWGQIPLPKGMFHEGGYTLRAYTNWQQNFGSDYFFSKRFYLGTPTKDAWLVKSAVALHQVADKDQLEIQLKINRADKSLSPVALRPVEVKIFESRTNQYSFQTWIYKERLQTGIDGSITISKALSDKLDGKLLRMEIRSMAEADGKKVLTVPLTIARNQKIDLQFLPEGGSLVAGIKSVVGFKAIGEDGIGVPVTGAIYNANDKQITSFTALHKGIGSFEFTPQPGESYTARLTEPSAAKFNLPKIAAVGTVMHIVNTEKSDTAIVNLLGLSALNRDSAIYLIGSSKGRIYYSQKINIDQPTLSVDKKLFPSGIARFTLFIGNRPLNERIIYIDHNDGLSIALTPDKATYGARDSVTVNIEVKDKSGIPTQGNFSLSVTDDSQIRADNENHDGIITALLLKSDLKGEIESPGYYIHRTDKKAWLALDNLLLTQGWTGFDWKDVFAPAKAVAFEAEKEFKISGFVDNMFRKKLPGINLILSSQKPQFITTDTTNSEGKFVFRNLPQIDSGSFFIQANNKKGTVMTTAMIALDRFKAPPLPVTLRSPIAPWYLNTDSTGINQIKRKTEKEELQKNDLTGIVLDEVKIKQTKVIKDSWYKGGANIVLDEEDIKKSGTENLYDLLKQKVPGFKVINDYKYRKGAVTMKIGEEDFIEFTDFYFDNATLAEVLGSADVGYDPAVDGNKPNNEGSEALIETLKGFKIPRLKAIQVALSRSFPLDYRPKEKYYFAQIFVTTNLNGLGGRLKPKPGTTTLRPLPVLYPQQFYSPQYKTSQPATALDFRSTIHWEPNIVTDINGKAKVSFYTSDVVGPYTLKIAGADANGDIGDAVIKLNKPVRREQ